MRIIQSAENRRKECHRFWLRFRHTVILISNDGTSVSKKINRMVLIQTLTVSTIAFERKKEELSTVFGRLNRGTNIYLKWTVHLLFSLCAILGRFDESAVRFQE